MYIFSRRRKLILLPANDNGGEFYRVGTAIENVQLSSVLTPETSVQ